MKKIFAALCLLAAPVFAQTPSAYPTTFSQVLEVGLITVPSSTTTVFSFTVRVDRMYFSNRTGSAVTVTVTDGSTNCTGSSACQLFPAVSIAANSTYAVDLGGVTAQLGVKWSASSANAVDGWIKAKQ
jgi:hypothetical protein